MQGKVEICGVNTSKLTVLSQKAMDALLRRAKNGEAAAREALLDDLFQVGCIGLIKAMSNFDPDKQVRFSTYGVPTI